MDKLILFTGSQVGASVGICGINVGCYLMRFLFVRYFLLPVNATGFKIKRSVRRAAKKENEEQ